MEACSESAEKGLACSGYDQGDKFRSPEEVREYFSKENFAMMFPNDEVPDPEAFEEMAELVIAERRHCNF